MKVILDTNVLISGLLNPYGAPGIIIGLLLNNKITVCYDSRILYEYEKVLSYPKFSFDKGDIESLIEFIKEEGLSTVAEPSGIILKDTNDIPFIEVGLASRAAYLIAGNKKHYPNKVIDLPVVTPSQFIQRYYT